MNRLTTRDYKKTSRRSMDVSRLRDFGVGVLVGAVLATSAFLYVRDAERAQAQSVRPEPRPVEAPPASPADASETQEPQYDFYEMLPKFEVVVPERDRDVKRDFPASRIERPGIYVLQAGSYRNLADAERMRAQLALQGIEARVQRVSVDNDVWHRVRIGPVTDLDELNRLRRQLQAGDIDALVIRVGD